MLDIAILSAIAAIVLIRNQCVYRSRIWMIHNKFDLYYKMPSYEAMLINPIHWKRWTGKQWEIWLLKGESNA